MSWIKFRIPAVVLMALAVWAPGLAQTVPPAALSWACEQQFDDRYHVQCVPRLQATPNSSATPGASSLATSSIKSGPVRSLLPVAHRSEAEVFAVPAWRVPLHALPLDRAFVVELLIATLCGRAAGCTVDYTMPEVRGAGWVPASRARPPL